MLDSLAHIAAAPHAVTDWTTALTATHAPPSETAHPRNLRGIKRLVRGLL